MKMTEMLCIENCGNCKAGEIHDLTFISNPKSFGDELESMFMRDMDFQDKFIDITYMGSKERFKLFLKHGKPVK